MVQLTTRERVDAFWSQTLAVDSAALHSPGVHARPNPPERSGWRGIYVLAFDKAANIFCPSDLLPAIRARAVDYDAEAALEPAVWRAELGTVRSVLFGPSIHHYRDTRDGLADFAAGRRINPRDAQALGALRGAVSHEEWSAAGFVAQSALLFGLFEDDRLMAAANLTPGPDSATDVGVIVHPEARGRGYEARVAATAALQAIAIHGVARLRALADDPTMLAVASTLGFTEYGRNLVIFLPA
jgi:GNAT superfamily N-acetyltransferase